MNVDRNKVSKSKRDKNKNNDKIFFYLNLFKNPNLKKGF